MSFQHNQVAFAQRVLSHKLVGYPPPRPGSDGNCFRVEVEDAGVPVLNFWYEHLQKLVDDDIVRFPLRVKILLCGDQPYAVVHDPRIPREWYPDRWCSVCTPVELLPAHQLLERERLIDAGVMEVHEVTEVEGLAITSYHTPPCHLKSFIPGLSDARDYWWVVRRESCEFWGITYWVTDAPHFSLTSLREKSDFRLSPVEMVAEVPDEEGGLVQGVIVWTTSAPDTLVVLTNTKERVFAAVEHLFPDCVSKRFNDPWPDMPMSRRKEMFGY